MSEGKIYTSLRCINIYTYIFKRNAGHRTGTPRLNQQYNIREPLTTILISIYAYLMFSLALISTAVLLTIRPSMTAMLVFLID